MKLLPGFAYRGRLLRFHGVDLEAAARRFGTPLYLYSADRLRENFRTWKRTFRPFLARGGRILYAVKANANPAVLRLLAREGSGADVVSGGELRAARKAGFPPSRIVFSGVGKTEEEISLGLRSGVLFLNLESYPEMRAVDRIARRLRRQAPVGLRINPDLDPRTHPHITTGRAHNKFGIDDEEAIGLLRVCRSLPNLSPVALHCHVGSQIAGVSVFRRALKRLLLLSDEAASFGIRLKYVDIGGGLGIPYLPQQKMSTPADLARAVGPLLRGRPEKLLVEPGRSIAGDAGVLLTRVLYLKRTARKNFAITDAGMTCLLRPALYGAHHEIYPCQRRSGRPEVWDIAGPICESSDILGRDRRMGPIAEGDVFAVACAGAYGYSMASHYNLHPRPAEVLADSAGLRLVRRRDPLSRLIG